MFKFKISNSEKIFSIHRQAEVLLVKPVFFILLLIYFPWAFLIKYDLHTDYRKILLLWTITVFMYGVYKYILWLLNICIITEERLIIIKYKNLFNKLVLETPIKKIHNISYETKGMLNSMFGIGNVIVQISSLAQSMIITNLKNPDKVKDELWTIHSSQNESK